MVSGQMAGHINEFASPKAAINPTETNPFVDNAHTVNTTLTMRNL